MKSFLDVLKFLVQIIPFLISFFEKKRTREERKEIQELKRRSRGDKPMTMADWSDPELK